MGFVHNLPTIVALARGCRKSRDEQEPEDVELVIRTRLLVNLKRRGCWPQANMKVWHS
jgi:hypothetical protein